MNLRMHKGLFMNEEDKSFEITSVKDMDVDKAVELISQHYPYHLTYNGVEFFDTIYMGKITAYCDAKLRSNDNGQESYLGYLPDEDVFIEGYDMFEIDDFDGCDCTGAGQSIYYLSIDEEGNVSQSRNVRNQVSHHGMMYGKYGGYDELHKAHRNLIDIRLD